MELRAVLRGLCWGFGCLYFVGFSTAYGLLPFMPSFADVSLLDLALLLWPIFPSRTHILLPGCRLPRGFLFAVLRRLHAAVAPSHCLSGYPAADLYLVFSTAIWV